MILSPCFSISLKYSRMGSFGWGVSSTIDTRIFGPESMIFPCLSFISPSVSNLLARFTFSRPSFRMRKKRRRQILYSSWEQVNIITLSIDYPSVIRDHNNIVQRFNCINVKVVIFICLAIIQNVTAVKLTRLKSFRKIESSVYTVGKRVFPMSSRNCHIIQPFNLKAFSAFTLSTWR